MVGFDIDTAREVCNRLGVELVAQPIDWNAKEQELATGNIDCIWNGFTVTDERREQMLFSDPYVDNAQVIVVRGDSPAQTIADLEGATVGVQAGSSAQDAINDTPGFVDTIGEVIEFKENLTALMDLEIGGCDAVVMDLLVANDNINRSGSDFRILDETLVKDLLSISQDMVNLDSAIKSDDDSSSTFSEFIEDPSSGPEAEVVSESLKAEVHSLLMTLNEKERMILTMRYGLDGSKPMSLKEIGMKFGLTKERIRQIEKRSLEKLRDNSEGRALDCYTVA